MDVGHAELGAEDYSGKLRFNGYNGIGIGVSQLPTANALDVDKAVRAELERLKKRFPPGLEYAVAFDTTTFVGDSIREVLKTLIEAILCVMLVMFVFLQDWRSTLIPAVTIPVSLIGAFAFIKLLDFSINTLTLFGIVLATGLVVDDAIVVIENIQRHMGEEHCDSRVAASNAMGEVTGAVVATSLVLVAVFVPVAFFPGTTGLLYKQFSLTIAFSIAISAFNSLTFTPSLSALLLRPESGKKNVFFRGVEHVMHRTTELYVVSANKAVKLRYVVLVIFFAGLAATYVVYKTVPTGFVPDEDQGWFMITVQAPQGASVEYTSQAMRQVEAVCAKEKDIIGAFSVVGFSFTGSGANKGMVFLNLANIDKRKGEQNSAAAVVSRLRGPLSQLTDIQAFPFLPPAISGISSFGGFTFEVQDEGGNTVQELYNVTQGLVREGNSRKDLSGLFSAFTANDPQFVVKINRAKARSLQVPIQQISDALQVYMGSAYVNDFDFNSRAYRVYVQADQSFRRQPRDIREFYVRSENNEMIPLDNVVKISESTSPQVITHYNLFRSAEIDGSAASRLQLRPGAAGDGAGREKAAAGLQLFLVGTVAGRDQVGQAVGAALRPRAVAGVPHAVGAVRKLCVALHHSAERAHGDAGRADRAVAARPVERRLLPDRTGDADRSGLEERHSDRRVRRAVARTRDFRFTTPRSKPRASGCGRS